MGTPPESSLAENVTGPPIATRFAAGDCNVISAFRSATSYASDAEPRLYRAPSTDTDSG